MRVTKKIKAEQIAILGEVYKDVKPALKFRNPFELLVAVILSAKCTDVGGNITTERLFAKAPTPQAIVDMGLEALEQEIRDCGLFRNKAKNIRATCEILVREFDGRVPEDFDELMKLPGVGRKSANLIMGDVFGKPAIVTDTHCIRLVNRMGLVDGMKDPKKVEMALWKIIPGEKGSDFCHRLVYHGREVCTARKAYCEKCCLADICKKKI